MTPGQPADRIIKTVMNDLTEFLFIVKVDVGSMERFLVWIILNDKL